MRVESIKGMGWVDWDSRLPTTHPLNYWQVHQGFLRQLFATRIRWCPAEDWGDHFQ